MKTVFIYACMRVVAVIPFLFSINLCAQLVVDETVYKDSLANLITGNGVSISNVMVDCNTTLEGRGYGSYEANVNSLGLTQGLILTTGKAGAAVGPNSDDMLSYYTYGELDSTDSYKVLLENYTGGKEVFAYCVFSFDVIPQGDTISFDYMFASEEYNEFVDSHYNDAFAFFISGPGIVPDANAGGRRNIARVPNSNVEVSINTVNNGNSNDLYPTGPCMNCAYFESNTGSYTEYDGYTKNLVAYSKVLPCSTYKLELIIADCSDDMLDSGVFIEKIKSNTAKVSATTASGLPEAIEGCNAAVFTFTRPDNSSTSTDLVVNYWLTGTAVNGVDYPAIGNTNPLVFKSITIPTGQNSTDLTIHLNADGIDEAIENIHLSLYNAACPFGAGPSVDIQVKDSIFTNISPRNPTICEGSPITMSSINGVSYTWSPTPTIIHSNGDSATFMLNSTQNIAVTAIVGACNETKNTLVTVNPLPIVKTFIPPLEPCFGGLAELKVNNSELGINYQLVDSATSSIVGGSVIGNGAQITMLTQNISSPTTYKLNGINSVTGCFYNDMSSIVVNPSPLPTLLGNNNDSRTCLVGGNNWVVFTAPGSTRAIASIHPNNQYLGWVTITEYLHGNTINVQACGTDPINQPQFTTAVVGRNWVVTPEYQPSSDVTVRVYVDDAEFLATQTSANGNMNPNDDISALTSVVLSKYSGPNEDNNFPNNCFTGGNTTLHNQLVCGYANIVYNTFIPSGLYLNYQIPSFSELWLHGNSDEYSSPLPVVLKDFDVRCGDEGANLTWTTLSEVDNDYFSVQYSDDTNEWIEITRMNGQQKSNQPLMYSFTDYNKKRGLGYYRLKQVDLNGNSEMYPMKSLNCNEGDEIGWNVYPNPTTDNFYVTINSGVSTEEANLQLLDVTGKLILDKKINLNSGYAQVSVNTEHLAKGAYVLKVNGIGVERLKPLKIVLN